MGSEGQRTTKDCGSAWKATRELEKLVAEKEKKGYRRVKTEAERAAAKRHAAAKRAPRNPALEAAILAAPDDVDAYRVYGDWLTSQGDPRGELVQVQIALAGGTRSKPLARRAAELLAKHGADWIGDAAAHPAAIQVDWRYGFVRAICRDVDVGKQREADEYNGQVYRYASVGE